MTLKWSSRFELWEPAELGSSLALWLDADDASTITLNGSTVSQWNDKSGKARHLSQATAANQPIYQSTGLDGSPVVNFDTTAKSILADTASDWNFLHDGTGGGYFAVWNVNDITNTLNYGVRTRSAINGILDGVRDIGGSERYTNFIFNSGNQLLTFTSPDGVISFANTFIYSQQNGSAQSPNVILRKDGDAYHSQDYVGTPLLTDADIPLRLGGFAMRLAEFIAVEDVLTDLERQKLEGYLAHKWGLVANLPSNHPYKLRPPAPGV